MSNMTGCLVSVLFNEPKLLKSILTSAARSPRRSFSALQRAEIAEINPGFAVEVKARKVSVLFNEPKLLKCAVPEIVSVRLQGFSALQRAEIAEIKPHRLLRVPVCVSVLFNEPKLLKSTSSMIILLAHTLFQCSSTSRNC